MCPSVSLHSIWVYAQKKSSMRFLDLVLSRHPEMMARRKGISPDEIANFLLENSENESDDSELSCSDLDSDKGIRLSERD
ncbi:hypothetical protein TNCV_1313991 [Trichonephila clavipes]|nr:hypothetical protein TNCV_1313991 [Trichonephila clavipes]